MAPAVGLGHAATALSLLALGLNLETRFRAGGLPTAPLSEPEPELDRARQCAGRPATLQDDDPDFPPYWARPDGEVLELRG